MRSAPLLVLGAPDIALGAVGGSRADCSRQLINHKLRLRSPETTLRPVEARKLGATALMLSNRDVRYALLDATKPPASLVRDRIRPAEGGRRRDLRASLARGQRLALQRSLEVSAGCGT